MKAIDYDRPVTRIAETGWYWAIFTGESSGYGTHGEIQAIHYRKYEAIKKYCGKGWRFYRARLPKPRKGAK